MADDDADAATPQDYSREIEDARFLFAWCLIRYGQVSQAQAHAQAREFYPDQAPGREYERALLFHDESWHWAMLRIVGDAYWIHRPELAEAPPEYYAEDHARCLARGESIALLDEDEYLGALAHARHLFAWTLVQHGDCAPDRARERALEQYPYRVRHHPGRFAVDDARDAWVDAMLAIHQGEYWRRPEWREPPQAYWAESQAFASAGAVRLPAAES
ncbi:hypothetical protein [Lysobacter enzymogenes]|uniref:Uncharacterized protein n=1 Tax=Lysobacter enzymogenes TaxID=69 RepID=A0A3N2RPQ3_LYSEN|nr:hypothetical protein [Lysobacter enzymogenes]ROU09346.1 hypothetical protein D9T17_00515 [Lysobacter enzymogenes]